MQDIPLHAQRVFTGVLFDVYQRQQELFDGRYTTFEIVKRKDASKVIMIDGDDILLTRQQQPGSRVYMSLLGGIVEEGELHEHVARRELREEAGIVPRKMIYLDSYNMGSKVISYHHFYIARGIAEQYDQELDGGEKIEILRISFEEFLSLFGTPDFVCHHKFQIWVMKEFIIPGQQAVLKELLFGM